MKIKNNSTFLNKNYSILLLVVVLILCNSTKSFSQNLINDLKNKEWISSTNDKITFNDSTLIILKVALYYKLVENLLIIFDLHKTSPIGNKKDTFELGKVFYHQDSIVLRISESSSDVDKIFSGSYISPSPWFKKIFNNDITFFNAQNLNVLKKDIFRKLIILDGGATASIDSIGKMEIISTDYNSFFRVNKGSYECFLDSSKFIALKEILFESGSYSMLPYLYEKSSTITTHSAATNYTLQTDLSSRNFKSDNNDLYVNISTEINSIITQNISSNNCNLKLLNNNDSIKYLNHNIISIDENYLQNGVESISGEIKLVEQLPNKKFLYQIKVDSNYVQRNVSIGFQKNQKFYGISDKKIDEKRIGITVQTNYFVKHSFNKKRKVINYFTIIENFDPNNSVYFDYYEKYNPSGYSRGVIRNMTSPNKRRSNKVENKIFKLTKADLKKNK
tara:strand:+ start:4555 stop:5898 length:1344 start_codon:yes stop_codon:yes gene_type:complete